MIAHENQRENQIATAVVDAALAAGYLISISDGVEVTVRRSRDRAEILGALGATAEDYIILFRLNSAGATGAHRAGWVLLIWGNDEELISDYVDNEETRAVVLAAEKAAGIEG